MQFIWHKLVASRSVFKGTSFLYVISRALTVDYDFVWHKLCINEVKKLEPSPVFSGNILVLSINAYLYKPVFNQTTLPYKYNNNNNNKAFSPKQVGVS
jgi:hypothetical protein